MKDSIVVDMKYAGYDMIDGHAERAQASYL